MSGRELGRCHSIGSYVVAGMLVRALETLWRRFPRRAYPESVSAPAIVVLGSSISGTCRRLVAEAERAATDVGAEVVIFSGWSGSDGPSEAEWMRALWQGSPLAELVIEETASTTAQNASRTLPLLLERGLTEAVVICTPLHLVRARWIFRGIYAPRGIAVRFRVARVAPTPGALVWELGALTLAGRP